MRSEKPAELLRLALELAANAEGMTIDEMAAFSDVGRRTIERRRAALEQVLGPLERLEDGRQSRFRLTGRAMGSFATAPTSEELAELENAARSLEKRHDKNRAEILRSLNRKIQASLRDAERNRLAPDIEARLRSEAFARQAGPRPFADSKLLVRLRQALLAERMLKFRYQNEAGHKRWHEATPYGLIFAAHYYLLARRTGKPEPVLFRLARITDLEVLGDVGRVPSDFDLSVYAERSFAVFQDAPERIALRFEPDVAADARSFLFHPTQEISEEKDGSLIIRFTACGLLEIARHLMTWGGHVTILEPLGLKEAMWDEVKVLYERYRPQKHAEARK